jgi:hypothetical protein
MAGCRQRAIGGDALFLVSGPTIGLQVSRPCTSFFYIHTDILGEQAPFDQKNIDFGVA